jgi:glutamyl-tRNA reductase
VGAGRIAQAAARLLAAAGVAGLVVVNRTAEAASGLAARYGGAGAGLERLGAELAAADVVLACVGVPDPLVTRADLETAGAATARRGVVIVDLGVPRCVAPDAATVAGVTLHDVDAVERASGENVGGRRRECDAAEALVADEARRFAQWRRGLAAEPTLVSLRERAESIRRGEIARFEREWDALSPADHERVDTLTRAILNRLLHEPTVRARAAAERGEGGHRACLQDLFGLVS